MLTASLRLLANFSLLKCDATESCPTFNGCNLKSLPCYAKSSASDFRLLGFQCDGRGGGTNLLNVFPSCPFLTAPKNCVHPPELCSG
jgi:hypothetical protein